MIPTLLKLTFIPGLKDIVVHEIRQVRNFDIQEIHDDALYLDYSKDRALLEEIRSVLNVYLIKRDANIHPKFIANHKSLLGDLIEEVIQTNSDTFHTYKLSCAGSDSKEITAIETFVKNHYKLLSADDADMEIYIGKIKGFWEVGVRLTKRPLSVRDYRVANIKGGLNPTIAYAMNTFCELESAKSYLNIFSGSATLLIEAANSNPSIKLVGFDSDGKTNALAIKNIKKAGFVKHIQLKTADIFSMPDIGTFDVITSDLPFGMQISKNEDLDTLYECFIHYCEKVLNSTGKLVVYTAKPSILEPLLGRSPFKIQTILSLKIPTSVNAYLYPKIFVCTIH